jgi:hypothetical protein
MMVAAMTAAVVAAPGTALAAPVGTTVIDLGGPAVISAGGAAVEIPFTFACPEGQNAYLNVSVVEAINDTFASGSGYKSLTCPAGTATQTLYLQSNSGQGLRPFKPGAASVLARLETYPLPAPCEGDACGGKAAPPASPPAATVASTTAVPAASGAALTRSGDGGSDGYEYAEVHATINLVAPRR